MKTHAIITQKIIEVFTSQVEGTAFRTQVIIKECAFNLEVVLLILEELL